VRHRRALGESGPAQARETAILEWPERRFTTGRFVRVWAPARGRPGTGTSRAG